LRTYGTNYTITSITEASDTQSAYTVNSPLDYGVTITKSTATTLICPATITINGVYDKHDGAGLTTSYAITVNMSVTFTSATFYGIKTSASYSKTPTEAATLVDSLNFTPGQTLAGLGSYSSIYYYTGSSTSAISQSLVFLTSITLNQTAINNGFTTNGSTTVSFSSTSLGSKTGTATLVGTYSGSGGTNPTDAAFSIVISLQEICADSINTSASYSNNAGASGTTFTDNINLATASSLFQYVYRGTIPTYSVTEIALNQTALDNGFSKPGGTSIAFSKTTSSTATFTGTATISGTYDKQDGNGNTTSFSLSISLSEVCTVSAKTMDTTTENSTVTASPLKTTFNIFNSSYFHYSDNSVVANLQISAVNFTNTSDQSIWTWSGSAGTYSGAQLALFGAIELTYGGLSGHIITNSSLVSVDDSELDNQNDILAPRKPGTGTGSGSGTSGAGGTGTVINTFTGTATVVGTYDNFLGTYVSFTKAFNLTANF
jgi:hypothetical protein